MRWHIIRTLLGKEAERQLANRGGIALAALLVVFALLLTFTSKGPGQAGILTGGVEACFVDYWIDDDWVEHLKANVPDPLKSQVRFRDVAKVHTRGNTLVYPPSCGAIQLRPANDRRIAVQFWYPDQTGESLAPFEIWFWRESARYFQKKALAGDPTIDEQTRERTVFEDERTQLKGGMDLRSSIGAALVLFALFFSCVYLLPSMMCEERERGILLAQALSPASPLEILLAKFFFFPVIGIILAATLAGITTPRVLAMPYFWLVLIVAAFGSLGIGLVIACLARTQRTASMGALCYMLALAMLMWICQQGNIWPIQVMTFEYHVPRMLHAALNQSVQWFHWINLAMAGLLACAWSALACYLFQQRGWQ